MELKTILNFDNWTLHISGCFFFRMGKKLASLWILSIGLVKIHCPVELLYAYHWNGCRYTNRQLQVLTPAALINFSDQQRDQRANGEKSISHIVTGCNSDSSAPGMQRCTVSPTTVQSKETELATSHSQQVHALPIPVKGVRFNDLCTAYGSVLPPMFRTQSGPLPMPSPSSVVLLEPNFQNAFYQSNVKESSSEQLFEPLGPNGNISQNHIVYTQEHKSEHAEDRGHISPTTDQSVSSSFCNGNSSHLNSIGYGSNCGSSSNVDQVTTVRVASESKNEDLTNIANSHRSIQREAALNKFRLKRKERCYEKKVHHYLLNIIIGRLPLFIKDANFFLYF